MEVWQIKITGRVQGVCFRHSVNKFVQENIPELKGYVRNCPDGSVEILAGGSVEKLQRLQEYCYQGPPMSKVMQVIVTPMSIGRMAECGDRFRVWRF